MKKMTRSKARRYRPAGAVNVGFFGEVMGQTGKRYSVKADQTRKAMPPGKRRSRNPPHKVYTETRANRSDKRGNAQDYKVKKRR